MTRSNGRPARSDVTRGTATAPDAAVAGTRGAARVRHPLGERADVGEAGRDRRIERLGGGDRGLDRGQAQDPLGRRREPDLGRVADRAGARRRRVDDEPDLARRDQLEDRDLAGAASGSRAELRDRPRLVARRRERRPRARASPRAGSRPPRARRPSRGSVAPCRGRRSTAARAAPSSAAAGRGGTSDAPGQRLRERDPRVRRWIPITSPVDCMPGPDRRVDAAQLGRRERRRLDRDERRRRRAARSASRAPASVAPSEIRTASSTIGTPVTFDMNGTVRDARGLTSIR